MPSNNALEKKSIPRPPHELKSKFNLIIWKCAQSDRERTKIVVAAKTSQEPIKQLTWMMSTPRPLEQL